jgi:hypothetical protein
VEGRTFADRRLHPDTAAVALDDLLADRQADTGSRIFGAGVKPLKQNEDALEIL